MHTRNPYRDGIDFTDLASKYLPLAPLQASLRPTIDFKDDNAQRVLTQAILKVDFDLQLDLPEDRLCPPVPNRLNYVLWIQDIVATGRRYLKAARAEFEEDKAVTGLDVGTGASAIYPLLACRLKPGWGMLATEIDPLSLSYARKNVSENGLQDRIRVLEASPDHIFGPLFEDGAVVDFTMCNPPFYSSVEEVASSREGKVAGPLSACTGSQNEMIYAPIQPGSDELASTYAQEGGEVGFVARMVEESMTLGARCRWYTSMLGKLSSVPKIVTLLKTHNITNYAITEFVQGQTRRWAVGWSHTPWRLPDNLARLGHLPPAHALYKSQPGRSTCDIRLARSHTATGVRGALKTLLEGMDVTVREELSEGNTMFVVCATENTWSRAARRARGKRKRDGLGEDVGTEPKLRKVEGGKVTTKDSWSEVAHKMVCSISELYGEDDYEEEEGRGGECMLRIQWIYGFDREMYEGFASHISRKFAAAST